MNTTEKKQPVIKWDRPMLERFIPVYEQARKNNQDTFEFEGNTFLVGYAKYLIEYLSIRLDQLGQ